MLGVRRTSTKLSSLERMKRKKGAKAQGLRRGCEGWTAVGSMGAPEQHLGMATGSPEGLQAGQMAEMWVPGLWVEALAG